VNDAILRRVHGDVTEPNRNALLYAPSNGVGGLRDYAHVLVKQWPSGSSCLPIGQFVNN